MLLLWMYIFKRNIYICLIKIIWRIDFFVRIKEFEQIMSNFFDYHDWEGIDIKNGALPGGWHDEMSPLGRHVSLRFASGDITYLRVTFRHVTLPGGHHFYNVWLLPRFQNVISVSFSIDLMNLISSQWTSDKLIFDYVTFVRSCYLSLDELLWPYAINFN